MKHLGTVPIKTDRLILRRFRAQDAQAMYDNWAGDDEVTKYLMWPTHEDAQASRDILETWTKRYDEDDFYLWAITLKDEGDSPIGNIAVVRSEDAARLAEIGYCLGRRFWNRGIMSEALGAVIQFLMEEVGVNRVEARHDPRNPGSGRVMQKCGMTYEGTLREGDWNNQGICDTAVYGILLREYRRG